MHLLIEYLIINGGKLKRSYIYNLLSDNMLPDEVDSEESEDAEMRGQVLQHIRNDTSKERIYMIYLWRGL